MIRATQCTKVKHMGITKHDSESYEKILTTFDLKFPRKYGAENIRKGFPSLRIIFEDLHADNNGNPPSPLLYAHTVWSRCEGVDEALREDVEARARRAYPSFCREVHLYLLLKERFGDSAEIVYSADLDMNHKTDFLVQSPVEPVAIRLHTHTNTWRGNFYGAKKKKKSIFTLNDEVRRQAADLPPVTGERKEVDLKLTLDNDNCHKTKNGFWLYSNVHVEQVVQEYEQLHE
jgi:hypothetical protein